MNRVTASERVRKELDALLNGKETAGDMRQFTSEFVRLAVRRLIQEFLEAERTDFLGRGAWERKPDSRGQRNGYEPARLKTGEGEIAIELPQVRDSEQPFHSKLRERLGDRTEVLKELVLEAYARGLSTRDVEEALTAATGGPVLSRSGVSEVTESLWADY